jgi:hypothetical protein
MKKSIAIFILFILLTNSINADCGHCFELIKTKISFNNGTTETSYLIFYNEFAIQNNIKPKINDSIKHIFQKHTDSVSVIDKYYRIKNLPEFTSESNKRFVKLKNIESIQLLSWTKIYGSFELPILSEEAIEKIVQSKSIDTQLKIFDVHDEIYINTKESLSLDDFSAFIKMSYNQSDNQQSILGSLKINRRNNRYPEIAEVEKRILNYSVYLEEKVQSISEININENINSYFKIYKDNLMKRLEYIHAVLKYLETENADEFLSFTELNISNDYSKKAILNELSNNKSHIHKVMKLCSKFHSTKEDHILMDLFYKTLEKEDIIILYNSWD